MSTPTPQAQFDTDFNGLVSAVGEYRTEQQELDDAKKYYQDTIIHKMKSIKNVEALIIYLISYVFQNSAPATDKTSDANIFGMQQDKMGLYGTGLKVNSLLTAVHTDIQNLVGSNSNDPTDIKNTAEDLDKILDSLPGFKGVVDDTTLANMTTTDTSLRNQFFIDGDEPHNPTADYHFVYHGGTPDALYLTTFSEMEQYMQKPGDAKGATEAYQALTDNLNSALGMTQTVNQALNEQLNQLSNFIKALQGFYENGLCQPWMKEINLAVQNQTKAG